MLAIGSNTHVNTPSAAAVMCPAIRLLSTICNTTAITINANDVKYSLWARDVNLSFTFDLRISVFAVRSSCIRHGNDSHHLLMPTNQMIAIAINAASSTMRSEEA